MSYTVHHPFFSSWRGDSLAKSTNYDWFLPRVCGTDIVHEEDIHANQNFFRHYPRASIKSRLVDAGGILTRDLFRSSRDSRHKTCNEEAVESLNSLECNTSVRDVEQSSREPRGTAIPIVEQDMRGCCQKLCCDYRVVPRTRYESCCFWSFRGVLACVVAILALILFLMAGSRMENNAAESTPDTSYNFITDTVCAFNPEDVSQPWETFASKEATVLAGLDVAHCGACGVCSNPQDTRKYVETRKTIAETAKKCSMYAILGMEPELHECLTNKIQFSDQCTTCWADNMITTGELCLMTCSAAMFMGYMTKNNVDGADDQGWLNPCLLCDEKMSGPAFVTCSGVARRRLGIGSEIERNPEEQCTNMDLDWLAVDWDIQFPDTVSYN